MKLILENIGKSLLALNILIFILAFIINDPFSWFANDYANAKNLISPKGNIQKLVIYDFVNDSADLKNSQSQPKANDTNKVNAISKIELTKTTNWNMQLDGMELPVDVVKLNSFLDALLSLKKFTNLGTDGSKFGFGDGSRNIELTDEEGNLFHLEISEQPATASGNYIRTDNSEIYLVPINILNLMNRADPLYLVQRKIFTDLDQENSELQGIQMIKNSKSVYNLGKNDKDWFFLEPEIITANGVLINELSARLKNLESRSVQLKEIASWKKIQTFELIITFSIYENESEESKIENQSQRFKNSLSCFAKDLDENTICKFSGSPLFYAMDTYQLSQFTDRTTNDFVADSPKP